MGKKKKTYTTKTQVPTQGAGHVLSGWDWIMSQPIYKDEFVAKVDEILDEIDEQVVNKLSEDHEEKNK